MWAAPTDRYELKPQAKAAVLAGRSRRASSVVCAPPEKAQVPEPQATHSANAHQDDEHRDRGNRAVSQRLHDQRGSQRDDKYREQDGKSHA